MDTMLRRLKIAWTVFFAVLAVALCVLWVRSYTTLDNLAGHFPLNPSWSCTSAYGRVAMGSISAGARWDWKYHNAVLDGNSYGGPPKEPRPWFIVQRTPVDTSISVPHGFLVLLAFALATILWLPFRFSLRTLLIWIT